MVVWHWQAFAKKNGLRELEHCTLPRTGALEIALQVVKYGERLKGRPQVA